MREQRNPLCDDVELYMIDGLNEEDRKQFEAHLAECEICRKQVTEMVPIVRTLPWAVDSIEPPAGMKSRVLARVLQQTEKVEPVEQVKGSTDAMLEQKPGRVNVNASDRSAPDMEDVNKRAGVKRWVTTGLAAAAVLLAVLSGVLAGQVQKLSGDRSQLSSRVAELRGKLDAINKPAATQVNRVVSLNPVNDLIAKGLATIVIDNKGMHLIVQAEQLPKLKGSEAFQVWLLKDGKPVNAGTFLTQGGTGALYYTFKPDQYDQIAITQEPDANGVTPRGDIVLAASLKSA